MDKQVFLIRVNQQDWQFKGKEKDWGAIDEGDWVPFWNEKMYQEDIAKIKMGDIIVGYSCDPKKNIESLGRVFSEEQFNSIHERRFLVQKTTQLKFPLPLDILKPIFESDSKLKFNRPTVTLLKQEIWAQIKDLIIEKNPNQIKDINKLEQGSDDWYI